jgi:hypothetical protein
MGDEIASECFDPRQVRDFAARLDAETSLFGEWQARGRLADAPLRMGYEVEACLIDASGRPAPCNQALLERMAHPHVVHELARFNVELNGEAHALAEDPFRRSEHDLSRLWGQCVSAAGELGVRPLMVGILPSIRLADLGLDAMSAPRRYRVLNRELQRLRGQAPLHVAIDGPDEEVHDQRGDVMLESAATSLQLHLQVPAHRVVACYNAAQILSAISVAVAANSPFLFGRKLWQETRVPLFEQAVAVPASGPAHCGMLERVSLGSGYLCHGFHELFRENQRYFPVMLSECMDPLRSRLAHLRLHNGTIWRWNRPLVGFDDNGACHVRVEHRVMAAGPSIVDTMANAAFFFGMLLACMDREAPLEREIPFQRTVGNFYAAARDGLAAQVWWLGGHRVRLRDLVLESLLPKAERALTRYGLPAQAFRPYLQVIRDRVRHGRTGAAWQVAWTERHGRDFPGLIQAYWEGQQSGLPVHAWRL